MKRDQQITAIFSECGIPVSGCCPFAPLRPFLIRCRAAKRLPEAAESVLVALFPYAMAENAYQGGNLSRYASVGDYHDIVPRYLEQAAGRLRQAFPQEQFEVFADNSPIPEVRAAALAGLGCIGKNGLLIHEAYGSWVFIGEIVTTLALPMPQQKIRPCSGCGRCLRACPTRAISPSGPDRTKCLSALTQQKGALTDGETERICRSGCAWGCDICQAVCPMNAHAAVAPLPEFAATFQPKAVQNGSLEGRAYGWRGRAVMERNLRLLADKAKEE